MTDLTRTERATAELRRVDEPGWDQLSGRIKDVLRSTVLPASTVRADHGAEPSDTRDLISTRALRALLRTSLQAKGYAPRAISFQTDGDRLTGVEIHLTVTYGAVLPALLHEVLGHASAVLEDALGRARADVDVHVNAAELIEQAESAG